MCTTGRPLGGGDGGGGSVTAATQTPACLCMWTCTLLQQPSLPPSPTSPPPSVHACVKTGRKLDMRTSIVHLTMERRIGRDGTVRTSDRPSDGRPSPCWRPPPGLHWRNSRSENPTPSTPYHHYRKRATASGLGTSLGSSTTDAQHSAVASLTYIPHLRHTFRNQNQFEPVFVNRSPVVATGPEPTNKHKFSVCQLGF